MTPHPYMSGASRRRPRRAREGLAIVLALGIALLAIGGGYVVANRTTLLPNLPFLQPTAVPTLRALDALKQIQQVYPSAFVHVTSPEADEVDLETSSSVSVGFSLTPAVATHILSIYMRGYPKQTFWRWIDTNSATRLTTVYEVHTAELWLIVTNTLTCQTTWTVYDLSPGQIISRGAGGGNYQTGVASHPGVGAPPATYADC